MNSKIPVIRIILSVACLIGGVYFASAANKYKRRIDQWRKDEPVRIKVDLSEPGTYESSFFLIRNSAIGQYFMIESNEVDFSYDNYKDILKGLEGSFVITDSNNAVVVEKDFNSINISFLNFGHGSAFPAIRFYPRISKGDHNLRFVIEDGAPALAGKEQWLVYKYFICGFEYVPAMFFRIISVIFFIVGVVFVIIIRSFYKSKRDGDLPNESAG